MAGEFLAVLGVDARPQVANRAAGERWTHDLARGQVRASLGDRPLCEVGKRAGALLDMLSQMDPSRIPPSAIRELFPVCGCIDQIGRSGTVLRSIEGAQCTGRRAPAGTVAPVGHESAPIGRERARSS